MIKTSEKLLKEIRPIENWYLEYKNIIPNDKGFHSICVAKGEIGGRTITTTPVSHIEGNKLFTHYGGFFYLGEPLGERG